MNTTTVLQSSSTSPRGRRTKRSIEASSEPGKKPKKVNSELRKQQNRIASRNYREKRKRKLQYLQQLLRDDPTSQETDSATEASYDTRSRSVSAEYSVHGTPLPSVILPSNPDYTTLSSTSGAMFDPALAATTPYHSPFLTPSLPVSTHEPSWTPHPQPTLAAWDSPHWAPSLDFATQLGNLGPGAYSYTPPQTQTVFETIPARYSSHPENQMGPNPDGYMFTNYSHCRSNIVPSQGTPTYMDDRRDYIAHQSVYI